MKGLLSLLLLTTVLAGCSYHQDMSEIHDKSTEKAEEVLQKHSDQLHGIEIPCLRRTKVLKTPWLSSLGWVRLALTLRFRSYS